MTDASLITHSLADYDFEYSDELVARVPAEPRDSSRLMVLGRDTGHIEHARFSDLPRLLRPGDCVVVNRTKVLPARWLGRKPGGGKTEVLLVAERAPGLWTALAMKLKPGLVLTLEGGVEVKVESLDPATGEWLLRFPVTDVLSLMMRFGQAPLPPYIGKKRPADIQVPDKERYQTVYAREEGSIAAPTAGLHFTPALLERLARAGIEVNEVTLHVGRGTFRPVTAEDVREHAMLPERYFIEPAAMERIRAARERGGRVIAVGTTSVRSLESAAGGRLSGEASLYIYPGYEFKAIDALITNFHLPQSTPLLLASAFAGRERLLAAYRVAVGERYRLFSYGDSMLIC